MMSLRGPGIHDLVTWLQPGNGYHGVRIKKLSPRNGYFCNSVFLGICGVNTQISRCRLRASMRPIPRAAPD